VADVALHRKPPRYLGGQPGAVVQPFHETLDGREPGLRQQAVVVEPVADDPQQRRVTVPAQPSVPACQDRALVCRRAIIVTINGLCLSE